MSDQMPSLDDEKISKALQGMSIPPQPQVLVDLHMECAKPEPSHGEIADIISQDVGLAAAVLKTVNSPFFGLSRKVSSVQHATNLMGLNNTLNIVNALSLRQAMGNEQDEILQRFWDTAQDVALACVTLARELNIANPEEAYTLGLFHNVGIPLMLKRFRDYRAVIAVGYQKGKINQVEDQFLSTNHATVGYFLARSWHLPEQLCSAIFDHHNLQQVFKHDEDERKRTLIAILKTAEHICGLYRVLGKQEKDLEWLKWQSSILEHLHLDEDELANLTERLNDMGLRSDNYQWRL